MALTTVTLHGQILAPVTNAPASGTVTFKILFELRDNADNVIYSPQTFAATLDINGEFSIILPITDDPNVTPLNWSYWVYVDTSVWVSDVFYIPLPLTMGPVVEFADLLPLSTSGSSCTPDGSACAPIGAIGALQAEIDAIETEIAGVQSQIDAVQALVDSLDTEVNDLSDQVAALTILVNNLQADVDSLNITVGALVNQVNILSPIVFANQAAITALQGQVATLQTDLTNLTTRVTTLEDNAVLLNPTSGGVYNGNTITTPPNPAGVQPWLKSAPIPYSAGDTNFDVLRIIAVDEFGNNVPTTTWNGNGEGRNRPSARNRIAHRVFESAEAVGYSTDQFAQWSTNPTNPLLREPLLAAYGSAHPTKPGWIEASRIMNALLGLRVEGNYNPGSLLNPMNFRGRRSSAGPPLALPWLVGDWIIDSLGVVYYCSVAGTPGTWVGAVNGAPVAVAFTGLMGNAAAISDGTGTGAPYALTTSYNPADNRVYFDGAMANNGGVSITGGTVLFTVNPAHVPAAWVQCNERTSTLLSARVTVRPDGTCRLDQAMAAAATLSLDGYNYRKS